MPFMFCLHFLRAGSTMLYRLNKFSRGSFGFHMDCGKIVLATVSQENNFFDFRSSSRARRMAGVSIELSELKSLIVTCNGTISSTPGCARATRTRAHARDRLLSSIGELLIVDMIGVLQMS